LKARWGLLLIVPLLLSATLLLGSQFVFLKASFFADLGFGKTSPIPDFSNYILILTDRYYLGTLWLTTYISSIVALFCVVAGFPIANILSRLRSRWTTVLLSVIVLTSFVTTVIQIFGLIIIFRADGPINSVLLNLGLIDRPFSLVGSVGGVVVGLIYASFGFTVMLMYSIAKTIPSSLEEAAAIHGATRLRIFVRIIFPLSMPGLVVGFLTVFNLSMGAFTSAALLGGGRVITLPVLIQRTMLLDVKYGMAGALAAVLLAFVVLLNLLSVAVLNRFRAARMVPS
jgi:ABC-type spermidine/putrescine transport system permease subunit I